MTSPARTLTANQQNRRHRILTATRRLVAGKGYDGTIMRDVAALAGVSPTTLYNLYNTKDELLLEALRDSMGESMDRAVEMAAEPGFERLMAQLETSAQQTAEEPAYARAITQSLLRAAPGDPIIEELYVRTTRGVSISLANMAARKELQTGVDTGALAVALVSAFWGVYAAWSKALIPTEDLHRELQRAYLSLLRGTAHASLEQEIQRRLRSLSRHRHQ